MANIVTLKAAASTLQSIQAVVFEWLDDGSKFRISTHSLNAAEGGAAPVITGFPETGQPFYARLRSCSLGGSATAAGLDRYESATIEAADPDAFMWSNLELVKGFAGARATIYHFFWDVGANTWSDDYQVLFSGICGAAGISGGGVLSIPVGSTVNLRGLSFPPMRIQQTCPLLNPVTADQRADAASVDSPFYRCGETRSLVDAPPCAHTVETCTQPNRFAGVTFRPPVTWSGVSYLDKKGVEGRNFLGGNKYGQRVPVVYGTAWVKPQTMFVLGEGNSSRAEVVVSDGQHNGSGETDPGDILQVVVGGYTIPFVRFSQDRSVFRWQWLNPGNRDGGPNADAPMDGHGDPYGNMAAIWVVTYPNILSTGGAPEISVLMRGAKIRVYSSPTDFTLEYSSNPAWVLFDVLRRVRLPYSINLASFIAAAAVCAQTVTATNYAGTSVSVPRFGCSFASSEPVWLEEVIASILAGMRGQLAERNGALTLSIRGTLASQQPSAVTGSNNASPITSLTLAGATANGYSAFDFNESNILMGTDGPLFEIGAASPDKQPNRIAVPISADDQNGYVQGTHTVSDEAHIALFRQPQVTSLQAIGVSNSDQAARLGRARLLELLYGNGLDEPRGTQVIRLTSSVIVSHLRAGDICRVRLDPWLPSYVLARVSSIRPSLNFMTAEVELTRHADYWYTDSPGQTRMPRPNQFLFDRTAPYPWQPYVAAPIAGHTLMDPTERTFGLAQSYTADAAGVLSGVLTVRGVAPLTSVRVAGVPAMGLQLSVSNSGGSLVAPGQYFVAIAGVDADGNVGMPGRVAVGHATGTGSAYSVVVSIASWPAGLTGFRVYAGLSPMLLAQVGADAGQPATVTITGPLPLATLGPVDPLAKRLVFRVQAVISAGVFTGTVTAVAGDTVSFSAQAWTTDTFAGYDVELLAGAGTAEFPLAGFVVTGNGPTSLTLSPSPSGVVAVGATLVIRSKPTSVSGMSITDTKFAFATNSLVGEILQFTYGPGEGFRYVIASNTATQITVAADSWAEVPDSTSRFVICSAAELPEYSVGLPENKSSTAELTFDIPISNYAGQVLMIEGITETETGIRSVSVWNPRRMVYVRGSNGAPAVGVLTFDPALFRYGAISAVNCQITGAGGNVGLGDITMVAVFVDETTADAWVAISGSVGTATSITVTVSQNPDRITAAEDIVFAEGEYVLFGDAGHWEIGLITGVAGAQITIQRNWPGDDSANAIFSSLREAHADGTKLYLAQTRKFTFSPSAGDYDEGNDVLTVADRLDMELPNACVLALVGSAKFGDVSSEWTVNNLAGADTPGYRTLSGVNISLSISGTLVIGSASAPKLVQFAGAERVAFAQVGTAPTGSALTVKLQFSDDGATWVDAETLTVAAGSLHSFAPETLPNERRIPYSGTWPYPIMFSGRWIRAYVSAVGSTVAGSNLRVEVYS